MHMTNINSWHRMIEMIKNSLHLSPFLRPEISNPVHACAITNYTGDHLSFLFHTMSLHDLNDHGPSQICFLYYLSTVAMPLER